MSAVVAEPEAERRAHRDRLADPGQELQEPRRLGRVAPHEGLHEDEAGGFGGIPGHVDLGGMPRVGLLAEDVLAGRERRERPGDGASSWAAGCRRHRSPGRTGGPRRTPWTVPMPCASAKARPASTDRLPTATTSALSERRAPARSLALMREVPSRPQRIGCFVLIVLRYRTGGRCTAAGREPPGRGILRGEVATASGEQGP